MIHQTIHDSWFMIHQTIHDSWFMIHQTIHDSWFMIHQTIHNSWFFFMIYFLTSDKFPHPHTLQASTYFLDIFAG